MKDRIKDTCLQISKETLVNVELLYRNEINQYINVRKIREIKDHFNESKFLTAINDLGESIYYR